MENSETFVVMDASKFKDFCRKRFDSNVLSKTYSEIEDLENEKIHLVPYNILKDILHKYYSEDERGKYDVFIYAKDKWQLKNSFNITDEDIANLLEENIIENMEVYKDWKFIQGYRVTNEKEFYDLILKQLTDEEIITIILASNKYSKVNPYEFYIVNSDNTLNILFNNRLSNMSYIIPNATLKKAEMLYLTENNIIESQECKINEQNSLIKLDSRIYDIATLYDIQEKINVMRKLNGRYIARVRVRDRNEEFSGSRILCSIGSDEKSAIQRLKEKLIKMYMGHTNINHTFEQYKKLLTNEEEMDMD